MKILFICENYFPHYGGVEVVLKNVAEGLVQKGHSITILTHYLPGTKKREQMNGVKIQRIPCLQSRYLFTFAAIPQALRLARAHDLIQTTTFNGAPPAWLAGLLCKKPVILMVHEVWVNQWKTVTEMNPFAATLHDWLERMLYALPFTRYVCVSKATEQRLLTLGIAPKKVTTIYNGLDYDHWNPLKYKHQRGKIREELRFHNNFICLYYGRPGTSKGLEYLLKAIPLLKEKIPTLKLLAIVSKDKSYRKQYLQLQYLIKQLHIQEKVLLHPPVPYTELPLYIQDANCVVVPSLSEGFGFSAAESCAMNVPVIASNVASLPEVVSGKYLLVPPKSPTAIAQAIEKVAQKKYLSKPLRRFLWRDSITKYLAVYEEVISKNAGRKR